MAKNAFKELGNLRDFGTDLIIAIDLVPGTMNKKVQNATSDIVRTALKLHGYSGTWRLNSLARNKHFRREMPIFSIKALCDVKGGGANNRGIQISTKAAKNRESCFESILIPPPGINVDEVYEKLMGGPKSGKNGPPPEPIIREAKLDEVYLGTVRSFQTYGAFICIFPENPPNMQEALCYITEITERFLRNPEEELRRGQLVLVKCIGFNDEGKAKLSRKALVPFRDSFKSKPVNGVLSMSEFTASPERVAIALNIIRESIETNSTKLAWARFAKEEGIVGGVFMEGKGLAFAPAKYVLDDLKEGIANQWRAASISRVSGLVRHLSKTKEYISPTHPPGTDPSEDFNPAIGYCMFEKGYEFLCREAPPLPEYYEPPSSETEELVTQKIIEALDQTTDGLTRTEIHDATGRNYAAKMLDDILARLQGKGSVECKKPESGKAGPNPEQWLLKRSQTPTVPKEPNENTTMKTKTKEAGVGVDFDLLEQYEMKNVRLTQLNEELRRFDELTRERDEITIWMEDHPEIPEQARLADELEKQLIARRRRLDNTGEK